jgi:hypothetical protein
MSLLREHIRIIQSATLSAGLLLGALVFAGEVSVSVYAGPKENLHVYLLIGQSNMAGRAPYTEDEAGILDRCYLLNAADQWEPAANPLNRYSTIRKGLGMQKLGPGYSFAKAMLAANPDIAIGLVVNAKGGSAIEEWGPKSQFYRVGTPTRKESR